MAIIYPTYQCNQNCVGCDYIEQNSQGHPATLSRERFDWVLTQIVDLGVRAVEFCGGGEPLLNPHIDAAIERLRQNEVGIGVLTNATVVSETRAELLAKSCSYVRVSIEAGSDRVFRRVKRPKSHSVGFDRVIANTCRLLEQRTRQKSRCQVSFKYAVDVNNTEDLEAAVLLAKRLGVDSIQFKSVRNVPSELSIGRKQALERELVELRREHPDVRILGSLLPLRVKVPCWLSPLHLMVDPVGDLYVCCYYRHRIERHRYGNLFHEPLRSLWYSRRHIEALEGIEKTECEKYDCRFIRYAELMDELVENHHLDFI